MNTGHEHERARTTLLKELSAVFKTKDQDRFFSPVGTQFQWMFDFRPLLMRGETLEIITELFWEELRNERPFQVGGLETTGIALVAGFLMKAKERGERLNGFYVRKSRRKDGFQKQIEGSLTDEKVILLDDGMNSGKSIMRQIKALETEGRTVHAVCIIVRFRDISYYEEFKTRGIQIFSLFTLEDFPETGGLLKASAREPIKLSTPYEIKWKFASPDPEYIFVLPKSAPAIDNERLYFGADNGTIWALDQSDGSVVWSFKTLFGAGKKRIFSSPAVYDGIVYVGAYDGNFYALDAKTGKRVWTYWEADWIGSSPMIAADLGVVFVGLEFGLWKREGGIAALDQKTGETRWRYEFETYAHSSPAYSSKLGLVMVGSSDGTVYALDARKGTLRWRFSSKGAVRAGFAIDEEKELVCFGSEDTCIYVLNAKGALVHKIATLEPIYSTPLVYEGRLYFGLLDKRVVCIDLATGKQLWEFWAHSRVFASPMICKGRLYIGSNDGRLYELDPKNGALISFLQLSERIVNRIAYNPATERFFVPTYANELYCLSREK